MGIIKNVCCYHDCIDYSIRFHGSIDYSITFYAIIIIVVPISIMIHASIVIAFHSVINIITNHMYSHACLGDDLYYSIITNVSLIDPM
jgi:hypothetical protein